MIEINNLTKSFDQFIAVDHITFNVKSGEVLGFLGPNGAGKSTTMKMITGFITPDSGNISVCNYDVLKNPLQVKQQIGYLPEGAPSYGDMTPLEYLKFIAEVRGIEGKEKQNQSIENVVEKINLEPVLHKQIDDLSKGFKRRVGIAQAMIHDPKVLILDEPTDGLDPNQKEQVRQLIKHLAKDKIIIISTHILEEVSAVCTRAVVIAKGKIVADETPQKLETRSKYHKAITLELKEVSNIESELETLSTISSWEKDSSNHSKFTLFPKENTNLFQSINELIHKNKWEVEELYLEKGRLDEVFRSITQ